MIHVIEFHRFTAMIEDFVSVLFDDMKLMLVHVCMTGYVEKYDVFVDQYMCGCCYWTIHIDIHA